MPAHGDLDGRRDAAFQLLRREAGRAHGDEHLHRRDVGKGVDGQFRIGVRAPGGEAERAEEHEEPSAKRELDDLVEHRPPSLVLRGELCEQGENAMRRDAVAAFERASDRGILGGFRNDDDRNRAKPGGVAHEHKVLIAVRDDGVGFDAPLRLRPSRRPAESPAAPALVARDSWSPGIPQRRR